MYRLKLTQEQYKEFKKKVRSEMILQDISVPELAERTMYAEITIRHFLSYQNSKFVASAIAETLGIEVADET